MSDYETSWDHFFIKMAMHISSKSKDPSTKVGCVIVGPDNEVRSTGYNGFPRGVVETVTQEIPYPVGLEKDAMSGDYWVQSSDGKLFNIGIPEATERRGAFDIPLPGEDFTEKLMDIAMQHEHFQQKPECALHPERWERPLKYDLVEHAERNAVYNAARVGVPLKGCRAYLNWEPLPCKECAKGFIQAGIIEVIGPDIEFPNHKKAEAPEEDQWQTGDQWRFSVSEIMLQEAGVTWRRVPWDAERGDCL